MADDALTAEELAAWYMPGYALGRVNQAIADMNSAIEAMIGRLRAGLIVAAAKNSSWTLDGRMAPASGVIVIAPKYWNALTVAAKKRELWQTSQTRFQFNSDTANFFNLGFTELGAPNAYRGLSSVAIEYFGIRFKPADIDGWLADLPPGRTPTEPPPSVPTVPTQPPVNRGGRPPKDWWDDLWIEMFRRIHNGDFKPKNQAELENAMHDWLAEHGQAGSVQTVRGAARKLFAVLKD